MGIVGYYVSLGAYVVVAAGVVDGHAVVVTLGHAHPSLILFRKFESNKLLPYLSQLQFV